MKEEFEARRVLLDENVDVRLSRALTGSAVSTVRAQGWSGLKNGELLRRAETARFTVFVTADRNLEYQQTLHGRSFGTVILLPLRLKLDHLLPLVPDLQKAIAAVGPGEIHYVRPPL